jgi:hypothetical protein
VGQFEVLHFVEKLHSNSFSPETSRISPVSAQQKLWVGFRMIFVKPEVTQNPKLES